MKNNSNNISPNEDYNQKENFKEENKNNQNQNNQNDTNENIQEKENEDKQKESKSKKNIDYRLLIKQYISLNIKDEEYQNKIKENPDLLFKELDESKLILWETILFTYSSPSRKHSDSDILYSELDREDQRIIINDCKRTRVRESILVPGFPKILEAFLTYYCTSKGIFYKQGLHEIFGPLILLKYKFKSIKLSKLYDLGEVIIDQFLPNYFYEKDIFSLQCSLGVFIILLKYHEPSVYNRFDITEVRPELYATSALTTLMFGKLKIDLVYELMDKIIKTHDPLIIHFLLVALLIYHREMIINCNKSYLATLMSTLNITSSEELNTIFDLALKLRKQTPYSFRILVNKIGFLKKNNKDIKKAYELYQPQSIPAMPIFPLEIFKMTNNSCVDCVDPECKNCKSKENEIYRDNNNEYSNLINYENKNSDDFLKFQQKLDGHYCEKCNMKIEKEMQNILIDLRILTYNENDDDTETGFLPKMIAVDQDELKSEEFSKIITERFLVERGNYHYIFLTTSTDIFSEFEDNYYRDNISELDKKKMMFGLIKQKKIDKELNLEDAQKNLTWKEIYKLKEYDNFRNTLKTMQKENFPYIGYVYGGFEKVHEQSFKYNYELLNHNEEKCYLCQGNNLKINNKRRLTKKEKKKEENIKNIISESLWKHKTKIKYSKINELYKGQNITLHFCILLKYKNEDYENENIKMIIILLFDKYLMELYSFEKQKEYKDIEVGNDIKEKKRKKLEYYDLGKEIDEEKDNDFILLNKFSVLDIISLNIKDKKPNIVIMSIRENIKDKNKKKSSDKIFEIILDFSSKNDSKIFFDSFKKTIDNYKKNRK